MKCSGDIGGVSKKIIVKGMFYCTLIEIQRYTLINKVAMWLLEKSSPL